jgi:threonine dehydrogenase-like Zn-dependent dehydrogenase
MLCAVCHGKDDIRLEERPDPIPGPGEVRIRVAYCGICGSDLHIIAGRLKTPLPRIIGHEYSGVIDLLGEGVKRLRKGQPVTVNPFDRFCGACAMCRRGKVHLCQARARMNGGYAQFVVVPAQVVYPVPAGVSLAKAALTEPVSVCLRAIQRGDVQAGDTVLVLGGGSIGLLLVSLARHRGAAQIILSEPNDKKRTLGAAMGATVLLDPREEGFAARLGRVQEERGIDVVFEAVGARETIVQALDAVGPGGTIVMMGAAPPGTLAPVDFCRLNRQEISIVGSLLNPFTFDRAAAWLERMDLDPLITHILPLRLVHEALDCLRRQEGVKLLLDPWA